MIDGYWLFRSRLMAEGRDEYEQEARLETASERLPVGFAGVRADGRCPWRPSEHCPWRPNPEDERLLRALAEGLTNARIGQRVGLSASTVPHKISVLIRKLGLHSAGGLGSRESRVKLAVWAAQHGYAEPEDAR